ncbi:MAG: cytochrome c [Actinobacteria bacterium]|nr:cytochrome c [Actinomycetota bacterium]
MLIAVVGIAGGLSSPALAATIGVDAPAETTVGETVSVSATISDADGPIVGADVAVTRLAAIGGTSGFVELDRGVTDESGVVEFEFVQNADSSETAQMRIEYDGPDGIEAEEFEMVVRPGPQQRSGSAGLDMGFVNVGWLFVVLALVWGVLILAVYQLVAISRANDGPGQPLSLAPYAMVTFVLLTAVGMFVVIARQPTTHANLTPNESFNRSPDAIVGEEYDYLGYRDENTPRPDDLGGQALYVQNGCAGCHGPSGGGAMAGGELTDATMSDREEVVEAIRRGPKGMPTYGGEVLTDVEIDRMIEYVLDANGD